MSKAACTSLLIMLAALSLPALGQQRASAGSGRPLQTRRAAAVPGQLIVEVLPGVDVEQVAAAAGGAVIRTMGDSTFLLQFPPGSGTASGTSSLPGTTWQESNFLLTTPEVRACGSTPGAGIQGCTIAFYDGNPVPESYYEQPTTDIINVAAAQDLSLGVASVVAVIDTGIDPNHEVFAGRIFSAGYDYVAEVPGGWDVGDGIDNDHDGLTDEAWGHGTHVSGIIALINPHALILPLRALDSDGNGSAFNVARAIHAALDAGADVINMSLGMTGHSIAVRNAIRRAAEMDVALVTSAGNTGGAVLFPSGLEDVVSVAALDSGDIITSFTAFGSAVEVSAPGIDIYSAMPGNAWAWWSGTSMSAAIVSGAASLLNSVAGNPDEADGLKALKRTGVDIDLLNPSFAELLGDGRIDVEAGALWILANPD